MIKNQGYSKITKELGVSRTAIVDRLKKYGPLSVILTQL
jgi:transcriptional regulator of aromatic amino acid metabolism